MPLGLSRGLSPQKRVGLAPPAAWSPFSDANVVAYFDARDLADGAVASWPSRIASGGSLFQSTGASQPIKGSGEVVFDGSNDRLIQTLYPIKTAPKFLSGISLPDASGNNGTGTAFTCTGITRAPDGTWWIGNFGHGNPSVGTGAPSLVHMSADFSTKLDEILIIPLIANANDLQGVAYDTSDNTLWFQDGTNKLIRHINLTTKALITADQITIPNADTPNGICYNAAHDSLFCNATTSNNIYEMSCATGTALKTYSYIQQGGGDHLFYDQTNNILWLSYGADNVAGCVSAINLTNASLIATYQIPSADCIEGMYIDLATQTLYLCNDGGYHSGSPAINRILTFSLAYPGSPYGKTSAVDLFAVVRFPTAPAAAKAILTLGQPTTTTPIEQCNGIGVYATSATALQVVAQTNNGAARHSVTANSGAVPNLATAHIVYVRVDTAAQLISMWVDGTSVGTASIAALDAGLLGIGDVINCGGATGFFGNAALKAVGYSFGKADRTRLQLYLSKAFGIALTG